MRQLTCDPSTEIIGQTMLAFIENVQSEDIRPYRAKYGLDHIDPNQWYPVKPFLDMLNEMAQSTNLTSNLVAIGIQLPLTMVVPPEMEKASLTDVLMSWDALYHIQHRGPGEIGYVKVEEVGPKHIKTTHKHIYPDDMTYGLAYGMAKRWLPKETPFKVVYDKEIPIRDDGGEETIIHVIWE